MSSPLSDFGQKANESTANWLRRLIAIGAPEYIVTATQQILASEQAAGEPPISALFLSCSTLTLFCCLFSASLSINLFAAPAAGKYDLV